MRKRSIILIIILVILIGILGFAGYKLINKKDKIVVPDFNGKNQEEVLTWCKSLETNPCSFDTEYSDTVEAGKVIYQSIGANEELDGDIRFIISLGKNVNVKLPTVDSNMTKESIEKWLKDNDVPCNVKYTEAYSETVDKGIVISIDPQIVTSDKDVISITISLGKKEVKPVESDDIEVEFGDYIDISESSFKTKTQDLGLKPNHNKDRDAHSSTIEEGKIVWHGSGTYEKGETINYGLSLGEGEDEDSDTIIVKENQYVELSLDEFIEKVEALGLKAEHSEAHSDDYSDTVDKDCILWHGKGEYEKGEVIHYTVSKGSKDSKPSEEKEESKYIVITNGQYKGKSEDQIKTIAKDLGLNPVHNTSWDDYSDSVEKGCVIRHGYASDYVKGEDFRYGLSKGKKDEKPAEEDKPAEQKVTVVANKYVGETENSFKGKIEALGLTTSHNSSKDAYSTLAVGTIVYHTSGEFSKGASVSYGLSLGERSVSVLGFEDVANRCESNSVDTTKSNIIDYFVNTCGFESSNISFNEVESSYGVGCITSIKINGSNLGAFGGTYTVSSTVVVDVVKTQLN